MAFILEVLGELLLQSIVEALVELGLHSLSAPIRRPASPRVAAFGYVVFGAILGGVSLLIFPSHLVTSPGLRMANLVITPILVGLMMMAMGAWRVRRGETVLRIDRFACGYLFALSLAIVRFAFAV